MPTSDPLQHAHILPGTIDSHFHSLEMKKKGLDPVALLQWCFQRGMSAALDVSVTPTDFADRKRMANEFPRLFLTAGIYPSDAQPLATDPAYRSQLFSLLDQQLDEPKVVAVGEIGLDAYHDYGPLEVQQQLLREQLALARNHRLPVVIHNRESDGPTLEVLRSAKLERGGVMHCFSSDYETARRFADLGFFISFAGNLTYKNSYALHEAARNLPLDLLLVETDAPYLAPVPVRGRPNHPGYVGHTAHYLAGLRNEPVEEVISAVRSNFERCFGTKKDRRTELPEGNPGHRSPPSE